MNTIFKVGEIYYNKTDPEVHIKIDAIEDFGRIVRYTFVRMPNKPFYRRVGDKDLVRLIDLEPLYELVYTVEGFEV